MVVDSGKASVYPNSNFECASINTTVTETNQLRAPNGRIFFPESFGDGIGDVTNFEWANVAYYDPADEEVHNIPAIHLGSGATYRHSISFSATFDTTGSKLYIGTQAAIGSLPTVYSVDPETLATEVIGQVGEAASSNPKYAYSMAKDEGDGDEWLYVAVGQDPFELVKINGNTGVATVLATTTGPGTQFIEFNAMPKGWRVNIVSNGTGTYYWLGDGAIDTYVFDNPPFTPRTVTPYTNPLVNPPSIDWSRGIGNVLWRPYGGTGEYDLITYDPQVTSEIVTLESLAVLEDGTVMGNGQQYGGFFKYNPTTGLTNYYGQWPGGVSQPALCALNNKLYIAGYPNGVLYEYNPNADWAPDGTDSGNPSLIDTFDDADTKYAYFLIAEGKRLYYVGRIERTGIGTGFGRYDTETDTFIGVDGYEDYPLPRGAVITNGNLVYSGEVEDGTAQLIVLDEDLNEVRRCTVEDGLLNTGALFLTSNPNIVVGLTNDSPTRVYRMNVATGVLLQTVTLNQTVGAATQHADLSIWAVINNKLTRINPDTLARSIEYDLTGRSIGYMAWRDDDLYLTDVGELLRMSGNVGAIDNPKGIAPYKGEGLPRPYAIIIKQMRKRR